MANILVVDDDPIAIQLVQDLLANQGHEVYDAEDWSSMNDQLFQRPYALVILDVNLPGLKGDALARIVARTLEPRPKVLLHSGIDEKELRRLARRVGAIGFISKGCSEAQMLRTVEAALASYASEVGGAPGPNARAAMPSTLEELVSKPPQRAQPPPPPPPIPSLSRDPGNPPPPPPPKGVDGKPSGDRPRQPANLLSRLKDPSDG